MNTSPISARIIVELRAVRVEQGMSARQLADRMTEMGFPVQRSIIANLENGRRTDVSVDHVVAAVRALGLDLSAFLVRCGLLACPACHGAPPAGFTCNTCGGAA